MPRFKPPFPASYGLYGKPTTINNNRDVRRGAVDHSPRWGMVPEPRIGEQWRDEDLLVAGDVAAAGQLRDPPRYPFEKLLEMAGGVRGGRTLKAGDSRAIVGAGAARRHHARPHDGLRLHAKAGSMLGSGAVIVIDDTRCNGKEPVASVVFSISRNRAANARHAARANRLAVADGQSNRAWRGPAGRLDVLNSVADNIAGRTICALGDAAALPVKSFIKHFAPSSSTNIDHQQCIVPHYM